MRMIVLAALALALVGCAENFEPLAEPPTEKQESAQAAPTGGDTIGIIPSGAGLSTPVTNADSITGSGGGGVQQAAKKQAKEAASKASGLDHLEDY